MNIQQKYEILSSAMVGIEWEIYSEKSPKEISKSLSSAIGKKVVIPTVIKDLKSQQQTRYHSKMEATSTVFKLERDFSGGSDMYEIISGPMIYEEARIVIIKVAQWIKQNGWTDQKCAIHLNVSFNGFKVNLKENLLNLNVLKFILSFDEEFIYTRFPNRKDSVYAKSIDNYYPVNRFVFYESPDIIDKNMYVLPNEKYYGINFSKIIKGYIEMRYLGGIGYENKTSKVLEILDYLINKLHDCLQNNETYTSDEKDRLHKKLKSQKKIVDSFSDPDRFLLNYPNIQLTVDMKGNIEIIKSYWTVIREILFDLIGDSGLRKGHLNFDTDISIFQLRDGVMKKANHIKNMELFDCVVSGTLSNCSLFRCNIDSSRMDFCKCIDSNEILNSKIFSSDIKEDNYLNNCYVENPEEIMDGRMDGGVIRKAIIGKKAKISKYTLIVSSKVEGEKKDHDSYQDAFSKKEK